MQRRRIDAWLTYRGDENAFPASEPSHHFVMGRRLQPRAAASTRTKPQRKAGSAVRDQRSSREAAAGGARASQPTIAEESGRIAARSSKSRRGRGSADPVDRVWMGKETADVRLP